MCELPETFDPSNPNGHAPACTEVPAYHLDIAPGDMTRYRLVVVPRPGGGLIVLWGEAVWFTSEEHGDDWLDPRTDRAASHNDHTRAAIVAILDEHVRKQPIVHIAHPEGGLMCGSDGTRTGTYDESTCDDCDEAWNVADYPVDD